MSIKVMTYVFEHSTAKLGARLVLLALADYAHDDGTKAFPSVETLTKHSRLSRRGVQDALRKLEREGHIVTTGTTRSGTTIYAVVMRGAESAPRADDSKGGAVHDKRGAVYDQTTSSSAPDPLTTHQGSTRDPTTGENARAELPSFNGKPVDARLWELTGLVLAEYNRQTSSKKRLLTSAGEASDAAKRIYGRVKSYPDITIGEYVDIIRRTLASRWWKDGPPTIGVIFGPAVFEENITRPEAGAPTSKHQEEIAEAIARSPQMSEDEVEAAFASVGLQAA